MYKILYQIAGVYDFKQFYEDESNTCKTTYGAFIQKSPFSGLQLLARIDFINLHTMGDTFRKYKLR
jgi:hypothetical protein